jgi:hypothetical protein
MLSPRRSRPPGKQTARGQTFALRLFQMAFGAAHHGVEQNRFCFHDALSSQTNTGFGIWCIVYQMHNQQDSSRNAEFLLLNVFFRCSAPSGSKKSFFTSSCI